MCACIFHAFSITLFFSFFQASQTIQVTKKVRSCAVTAEVCGIIKVVDDVMAKLLFPIQSKNKEYSKKIISIQIKADFESISLGSG